MPELKLYRVFDVSGLIHYSFTELAGRRLREVQTYALIEGKLYFQWPTKLDRIQRKTSQHRSRAYLLGFCHAVPTDITDHGSEAVEAYVAERVRVRKERIEKVRVARELKRNQAKERCDDRRANI